MTEVFTPGFAADRVAATTGSVAGVTPGFEPPPASGFAPGFMVS
ncbi:hypothetical protein [Acrocarpospora corrugata]|nr:hypothetical protein [Acrocarpospora corrugata]